MKPHQITLEIDLMVTFAQTLAALGEEANGVEFDVLDAIAAQDGVRLVAWMTPEEIFNPGLRELRSGDLPGLETVQAYRQRLGTNLQAFMEAASSATGKDLRRVRQHVQWAAGISDRELDRLLVGRDHLTVVDRLCDALHLDYRDGWVLVDPQRLAEQIDHSSWATAVAGQLRVQTTDQLKRLIDRLPGPPGGGALRMRPAEHRAPRVGHRYRALYEALARDHRDVVRLRITEVDQLLRVAGEEGVPHTARTNRAWWARTNSTTAAQPQIAAWAAAGYQVSHVQTRRAQKGGTVVEAVEFSSLPGRTDWLRDQARLETGTYRLPEPGEVHIDLDALRSEMPRHDNARTLAAETGTQTQVDHDEDVNWLLLLLGTTGEADRALIEAAVKQTYRPDATDQWISNLLTRARRQGRIKNHGTKSRPRWVESESKGDIMLFIAGQLGFGSEAPPVGPGPEVPEEFVQMIADALEVDAPVGLGSEATARVIVERAGGDWSKQDPLITTGGPVWLRSIRDAVINRVPNQGPADGQP